MNLTFGMMMLAAEIAAHAMRTGSAPDIEGHIARSTSAEIDPAPELLDQLQRLVFVLILFGDSVRTAERLGRPTTDFIGD